MTEIIFLEGEWVEDIKGTPFLIDKKREGFDCPTDNLLAGLLGVDPSKILSDDLGHPWEFQAIFRESDDFFAILSSSHSGSIGKSNTLLARVKIELAVLPKILTWFVEKIQAITKRKTEETVEFKIVNAVKKLIKS